uniref:Uncharacterized protein n=1 Tax=Macrostomum lignano TaxID=282301 RepID=A0A1I8FJF8_9PLAT
MMHPQAAYPPSHYLRRVPQRARCTFSPACSCCNSLSCAPLDSTASPTPSSASPSSCFCRCLSGTSCIPKLID